MVIARMPEDRSKTFKNLQKPSTPYTPVCVHLWGPLTNTQNNMKEAALPMISVMSARSRALEVLSAAPQRSPCYYYCYCCCCCCYYYYHHYYYY
eukprot:14507802-Heterocapsa_arctica.AAC.1